MADLCHNTHHVVQEVRTQRAICVFCHACGCHRPKKLAKPCPVEYTEE